MRLILAGGGEGKDSKPLDKLLLSLIQPKKILYVPLARKKQSFPKCKEWFSSTFANLNFDMLTNTKKKNLSQYGGMYIGGGNTFHLLSQLRKTELKTIIDYFLENNKPIYGGSAGAIIFGKDIRTAALGKDSDINEVKLRNFSGLNLAKGYAIQCHYEPNQDSELKRFSKQTKLEVIALSERSGILVENKTIHAIGYDPVYVFSRMGKKKYKSNSTFK